MTDVLHPDTLRVTGQVVILGAVLSRFTFAELKGLPVEVHPLASVIEVRFSVVFDVTEGPEKETPLVCPE